MGGVGEGARGERPESAPHLCSVSSVESGGAACVTGVGVCRKGQVRAQPLPSHLPRVGRIVHLPEADKRAMGSDWTFIGYDESAQLAMIPRQPCVIVFIRAKCSGQRRGLRGRAERCDRPAGTADQLKAIAHSSLLAEVVAGKLVDALPLYRREKVFNRDGIEISRQSVAGWMTRLDKKLSPLMAAMTETRFQGPVIHIDETRLQVLNEPGRNAGQWSLFRTLLSQ